MQGIVNIPVLTMLVKFLAEHNDWFIEGNFEYQWYPQNFKTRYLNSIEFEIIFNFLFNLTSTQTTNKKWKLETWKVKD